MFEDICGKLAGNNVSPGARLKKTAVGQVEDGN